MANAMAFPLFCFISALFILFGFNNVLTDLHKKVTYKTNNTMILTCIVARSEH